MDPETEHSLRAKIHTLLDWHHDSFPISSPVPMKKHHLGKINALRDYVVTKRESTIRALIYHGPDGFFWYGKDQEIRMLSLDNLPQVTGEEITLFDVEWVAEKRTFYIADACYVRGQKLMSFSLLERLRTLDSQWLALKKPSPRDKFKFVIKDFWDAQYARSIGDKELIIKETGSRYKPGRDPICWHWKPANNLSVVMRLKIRQEGARLCYSLWGSVGGTDQEQLYCELPHLSDTQVAWPNNALVECSYEPHKMSLTKSGNHWITGLWTPTKIRTDKIQPADIKDVWSIMSTIREDVTVENIADAFIGLKPENNYVVDGTEFMTVF